MSRMIFVNLPVADLQKSIAFYEAIGASADPHFADKTAQMMRISDEIVVMLLTHERFNGFLENTRTLADARKTAQVLLCLSVDSREDVDRTIAAVASTGADVDITPPDDYGFMYGRNFVDPDGHIWQANWMDVAAAMAASAEATA
ncbi:MAG: VOC family protein [Sphingobium sp.]|nr:VOC family protein [Sphingobium sp.]